MIIVPNNKANFENSSRKTRVGLMGYWISD